MRKPSRVVGVVAILLGLAGVQSSLVSLGHLLLSDGLGTVGARTSAEFALLSVLINALDVLAYTALAVVGVAMIGRREWSPRVGFVLGCYFVPTVVIQMIGHYLGDLRPHLQALREAGAATLPLPLILFLSFLGAELMLAFSAVLIAMGRRQEEPRPRVEPEVRRPRPAAPAPEAVLPPPGSSVAARAVLALLLMVGFYGLALGMAWGLVWIPYAELRYADRLHPKLAFFCLAGAFLIVKSILPRRDHFAPPGPRIIPAKHPRLATELRRTAVAAGQDMPEEIYLVPDVNAWVSQRGGIMGFGGRRVMGLGLPLLQVLRVSEMRAVIAHEFGHYHGGDVALGPWIYKTRQAIGRTLQALAGHSGVLLKPFEWYAMLFLRVSHAVSRRQELMADALAARIAGAAALASGLRAVHGAALAFQPYWADEVDPVLSAGFLPPLAGGFAQFVAQPGIAEGIRTAVDAEAREGKHDPYDTHPSLRDRLAALGRAANRPLSADEAPALSLLDDVAGLEVQLLIALAGGEAARKLQPLAWDDVGSRVYVPRWEKFILEHGNTLSGVTPAGLSSLDWDGLARKLAAAVGRSAAETQGIAEFAVGSALAVALTRRGFAAHASPGGIVRLQRADVTVEPFGVRAQLATGAEAVAAWTALCTEVGIADLDLARITAIPVSAA